jgi:hypothetical protein
VQYLEAAGASLPKAVVPTPLRICCNAKRPSSSDSININLHERKFMMKLDLQTIISLLLNQYLEANVTSQMAFKYCTTTCLIGGHLQKEEYAITGSSCLTRVRLRSAGSAETYIILKTQGRPHERGR